MEKKKFHERSTEKVDSAAVRPHRLKFENIQSAGLEIHADIPFNPNCIEFVMKKGFQPIMNGATHETSKMISYEPWIQFPDKQWSTMIQNVFKEMVELWNEKYSVVMGEGSEQV